VVAHSKEAKKNIVTKRKISTQVDDSSKTSPSPTLRNGISQTTPKVSPDFERVFSKVIGSGAPPATKPISYSETYQRAFGRTTGEKNRPPPKQEKSPIAKPVTETKSTPSTTSAGKSRTEGLSTNYTTVFGRLAKDEDAEDTKAEIRESLKKSMEDVEETKMTPEALPLSGKSVFEMLSHSNSSTKGQDSTATGTQETRKGEETIITPSDKPVRSEKSVFERLSRSGSE
jgi:hypothetical protein